MIRVRGARVHNLRDLDVDLPRDAFVVVTGVSGSGKSSLAFGTIYAEAQLRYLESVAPYARRLIHQVGAADVRDIDGLPPAVALQQTHAAPGSRSTVGTITTVSNSLRMLLSRAGTYPKGAARLDSDAFSPNTPAGACPRCHGLGRVHEVSEQSLVPDPSLSIREHAVAAWPGAWQGKNYRDILATLGYDVDRPWRELAQADRDWILFTDEQPVVTVHAQREAHRIQRPYQGTYQSARRYVLHTLADTQSSTLRRRVLRFVDVSACPLCHGSGLRAEAMAVTFAGHTLPELTALAVADLATVLRDALERAAHGARSNDSVPATIVPDVLARIEVLVELGLGYLSVARPAPTLSSGELQRLRLATALRSRLFGVVYVLDEPSAGLHPADTAALRTVLDRLRAAGNSLVVVEHDLDLLRAADWLIDIGPGAGTRGGRLLHSGPVDGLRTVTESLTRPYLFPDATAAGPESPARTPTGTLGLHGVERHNLHDLDVDIPLGVLTVLTGVSGSGKSTLLTVLADAVRDALGTDDSPAVDADVDADGDQDDDDLTSGTGSSVDRVLGLEDVHRLVQVDQRPIGRTPRSNLATYTGLFDGVRKLFAATDEARSRGYGVGRFSFNVAAGRCPTCQGEGFVAVELLFLPGTYSPCPTCHGARYNPETLEITWRGHTIADVLALTVDAAVDVFADQPSVERSLTTLRAIGLGYLTLGQPATELSGGEAQRIKLASELQRRRRAGTLYLLDEPTTGLHPADTDRLMAQLGELVGSGATVVLVEHDMGVAARADHVIDLGPGGGAEGGRVVVSGTPQVVSGSGESVTAPFLASAIAASAPVSRAADAAR
ncbi:ABC transporter [uncultured Jatrophihabitans sp.]|uniref:ABC transporter n=1 Tax=uncultured Jatrophihabitans sp. TaxID=1610747 RepID=UPI0035CC5DF6